MKNYRFLFLSLFVFVFVGCSNSQVTENQVTTVPANQTVKTELSTNEFEAKIKADPNATLIDVRTSEEYSQAHLQNAVNFDWNGNNFASQIATLDKTKPIYVYCLSGKRSGAAADKMRADGFIAVYELAGGIKQWQTDDFPVVK